MPEIVKKITLWRGLALAICMLIGTGILGLPGLVLEAGTPCEAAFGWLLIVLVTLPLIQVCARLGLRFPSTAGLSRYAEEAFGPLGGYVVAYLVSGSFLFGLPAVALIGSKYVQRLTGFSGPKTFLFSFLIISVMALSNLAGFRFISVLNYAALSVLLLLVGSLIFFNHAFLFSGLEVSWEALWGERVLDLHRLWKVTALLFWAFLGWENLSFSLGELKPGKKRPSPLLAELCPGGLYLSSAGADKHRSRRKRCFLERGFRACEPCEVHARRSSSRLAYGTCGCCKCLFLELHSKSAPLCRRENRDFSCAF